MRGTGFLTRALALGASVALAVVALAAGPPAAAAAEDDALAVAFTDVAGNPFEEEILWLAGEGISTGWPTGSGMAEFRPLLNVKRDVMAAFLYRLDGSNPPVGNPPPQFIDVNPSHVFYTEIQWMGIEDISTGWAVPGWGFQYRPYLSVKRDVMATFLYRYAGSPPFVPPATPTFTDVPKSHVFYKQIEWLADVGISNGWTVPGGKEFRPGLSVKRDVMAAFLYRYAHLPS